MIKSTLSVIAGYAVMVLATYALFTLLAIVDSERFGMDAQVMPGNLTLLVILLVGLGSALGGGWVTGRLAPRSPSRHINALVILVLIMATISFFT